MARSVLAVIAGYLVVAAAVVATFAALGALVPGAFVSTAWLVFLVGWGFAWMVVGGYVTAAIARRSEIDHALSLGALMVVLGVISMVMGAGKEPLWFQIANFLIAIPAVLCGGALRAWQRSRSPVRGEVGGV